ncbi:MAG: FtsX-like permease family protein [Clostridia bacterium]|nr:FtsX-like permease family protein [Clostridia bacterium]MCX4366615.1 FtsX-like permease family protein [Clostridia bacterium]
MIIGIKDALKLVGISIVTCCAVFVCVMFLNYNMDLAAIKGEIVTEAGIAMYNAQVSMGKVTSLVTGGCLVITSVIILLFYVKNYIDTRGKDLGILKALGYSNFAIAKHFWIFGLSVLLGALIGSIAAYLYLPTFYKVQNAEGLFPDISVKFHAVLPITLVLLPSVLFSVIAILYACLKLREPLNGLLKGNRAVKIKKVKPDAKESTFLKGLAANTLKTKKALTFLIAFSAFCFSAMVQMSISMKDIASETFAVMIISIGLTLAFTTLLMSLSSVVKGNVKTIAMMKAFGYEYSTCVRSIFGSYRIVSYIGFAVGTVYQYALLKLVMTFVFESIDNMPEYKFDFKALLITFVTFIAAYELIMYIYALKIKKIPVKCIMSE